MCQKAPSGNVDRVRTAPAHGTRTGRAERGSPDRPDRAWAWRLVVALVAPAVAMAACSTWQGDTVSARVAPEELLAARFLVPSEGATVPAAETHQDVLALTDEMRSFLDRHVDRKASDSLKLRQLVAAIIDAESFGLVYDNTTRTAPETFRARRGNCLSFSLMFLAMARNVDLDVKFQEVDIPPDWTFEKDTFVLNQHVNLLVTMRPVGKRVVDFNIGDFRTSYEMRTVHDGRALAHYFNNIGVERMQAGDTASALACFRRAIADNDRQFSPAWTNLGTLYLRAGYPTEAEAAYLQALRANGEDLVAMSDLARLYDSLGDRELAATFQKRVVSHRWRNPYYRADLARRAYLERRYEEAVGHLKYAIRKRPKEDQFYFLLGATYLGKGDERAARRWFSRAEELAATDAIKRRYASKVDSLLKRETR